MKTDLELTPLSKYYKVFHWQWSHDGGHETWTTWQSLHVKWYGFIGDDDFSKDLQTLIGLRFM